MKKTALWFQGAVAAILLFQVGFSLTVNGQQILHGHIPAAIKNFRLSPIGRLDSTIRLNLVIGLPLHNHQALDNLVGQIYDPANPNYHKYLSHVQFTQEFGPTDDDYQAVKDFATKNGLKVVGAHSSKLILDVSGKVADIERAFNVRMFVYNHPTENRTFFAPDIEPSVPSGLPILDIDGLNNYAISHPNSTKALPFNWSGSGPDGSYRGYDFRHAYVPNDTLTGWGQIVGLFEEDGYYTDDIHKYEDLTGLPHVAMQNIVMDGLSGNAGAGNSEVALDIEMAVAMAPNLLKVVVFEGNNWIHLLDSMAAHTEISQFSCSWGFSGSVSSTMNNLFEDLAVQGQSFFLASGDGDAFTGALMGPDDDTLITTVGGTELAMYGSGTSYASESVWNTGYVPNNPQWYTGADYWGSSGGISTNISIPSWQVGVSMSNNQGSTMKRNVPDVSMVADGVWVNYNNGDSAAFMGTSIAAPLWAGFIALANEQAVAGGGTPLGFVNLAVYAIGENASQYASDIHDIPAGAGNNEWPSSPSKFSAANGYDLCTGWGSPNGQALINGLTIFNVSLATGQFPEGGNPNGTYKINSVNVGTSYSGIAYHGQTITAVPPTGYVFYEWSDGSTSNPRSVSSPLNVYAIYKGLHISNDASAFSNNSQRKMVRTTVGTVNWLHQVYTSMGHAWLEYSTDNGQTWTIANGGRPLDYNSVTGSSPGSKCPSIDYDLTTNDVIVVFEVPSGSTYTISFAVFMPSGGSYIQTASGPLYVEGSDSYSINANPSLAMLYSYSFWIIAFEKKTASGAQSPGINYIYGTFNGLLQSSGVGSMSGTTVNSITPTIYGIKSQATQTIWVAWEENGGTTSTIKAAVLNFSGTSFLGQSTPQTISNSSWPSNYQPCLVEKPDNSAWVCWIANNHGRPPLNITMFSKDPNSSSYTTIDYNETSVSVNLPNGGTLPHIAYSQQSASNSWVDKATSGGTVITLSTTGRDIQLSNGATPSAMYASAFTPNSLPYFFQTSGNLGALPKISPAQLVYGRGGTINDDSLNFYYSFGNLIVDGNVIDFISVPDSVDYDSVANLNKSLVTEPFHINKTSKFVFSEYTGFADSAAAARVLGDSGYIECRADLIDNSTGQTLGTIKDVKLTLLNASGYGSAAYQLNTGVMNDKIVNIRITMNTNLTEAKMALIKSFAEENSSLVANPQAVSLQPVTLVTSYALGQNYPNPFNPSTIIEYQLPVDGRVTLKVYDVLGREVRTLVDDSKAAGRYETRFDASSLASGIYFYRVNITDNNGKNFVSTKKMLLVK